jgi:hypothetical protein
MFQLLVASPHRPGKADFEDRLEDRFCMAGDGTSEKIMN